jgi:hypothetical protein
MGAPPQSLVLLILPPTMWAGKALVGRLLLGHSLPSVSMNALRWALVALVLIAAGIRALSEPANPQA